MRKENLQLLAELTQMDLDVRTTRDVVEAAAKFADEGGLGYVQGFARHTARELSVQIGRSLRA